MSLYSANLPALLRAPSLSVTPPHPLPSEGPTGHTSLTGRPGRGGQRAEQAAGTCPGAHVCLEPPACPLSWLTGGGSGCQLVLTSRQAPPGLRPDAELCGAGAGISFPSRKDRHILGGKRAVRPSPSFQVPATSLQRSWPPSPCPAHRIRAQGTLSTARTTCTLRGFLRGDRSDQTLPALLPDLCL